MAASEIPAAATQARRHPLSITTPALEPPSGYSSVHPLSPVNQGGSFECDRVLKEGQVLKRRKRINIWDNVKLVLRPNILSIYSGTQETKLKHLVNLSEVSAVALRRDRKRKGSHDGVFGIFSPSRNFHLEADSEEAGREWVETLRKEARIDEQDEEMVITSANGTTSTFTGFGVLHQSSGDVSGHAARLFRAPSEVSETLSSSPPSRRGSFMPVRPSLDTSDPSSSEVGSYPDQPGTRPVFGSLRDLSQSSHYGGRLKSTKRQALSCSEGSVDPLAADPQERKPFYQAAQTSDPDGVLWHGYLECLKHHSSVRQWKRYWIVLRPKNLALYKSEEEYAALLILPFSSILDAVETDPVSKGRHYCMQIITDERSYRFSCADEEDLSKWLGALKSTLAKKKDSRQHPT